MENVLINVVLALLTDRKVVIIPTHEYRLPNINYYNLNWISSMARTSVKLPPKPVSVRLYYSTLHIQYL